MESLLININDELRNLIHWYEDVFSIYKATSAASTFGIFMFNECFSDTTRPCFLEVTLDEETSWPRCSV